MITVALPFGLLNQVLEEQERDRDVSPSPLTCVFYICAEVQRRGGTMGCVVGVNSDLEQHRSPPSSSPEHYLSRVLCMVVGGHYGVSDDSIRAIEYAAFGWFPGWLMAGFLVGWWLVLATIRNRFQGC